MKKTLQKGFSLVELLVVVAIIGVLAGVGIVGYQSYTESAKEKVAEANFNSVVRFIETELTLLNNGVQDASGALFHTTPAATYTSCGSNAFTRGNSTNGTVAGLKGGIACHFGTQDGGLKFKNPFKSSTTNAVIAIGGATTGAIGNYQKGSILIRTSQPGENGLTAGATATEGTTAGKITVVYVGKNESGTVPALTAQTAANGYKTKDLELK